MRDRLLADENVSAELCVQLRALGYDVRHVAEEKEDPRALGPVDEDVLFAAAADRRAVITNNYRDFKRLHIQGARHFGILGFHAQEDPKQTARQIHDWISKHLDSRGTLQQQCDRLPRL